MANKSQRKQKFVPSSSTLYSYQGSPRKRIDKNTVAVWNKSRKEYQTVYKRTEDNKSYLESSVRFTYFAASMGLGSKIELLYKNYGVEPVFFSNNYLQQQNWTENGRKALEAYPFDYLGPEFDGWVPEQIFFYLINEYLNLGGNAPDRTQKLTAQNYEQYINARGIVDFRDVYPNWQWRWEIGQIGYIIDPNSGEAKRYAVLKQQRGATRGTPPNKDPDYKDLRPERQKKSVKS